MKLREYDGPTKKTISARREAISDFCELIAGLNVQKQERLQNCIRLYSDIRSLLTPSSFQTILTGDLMMATLNKNIDIKRVDIVLSGRRQDTLPDDDLSERIMNTLLVQGNLKSFSCAAVDRYSVRMNLGGSVNLQFKTTFDLLIPCCNITSVSMKSGIISIDPRSLKAFAALRNLAVSPAYLIEDAMIAAIEDINTFKLRSHHCFSSKNMISSCSAARLISDWHAAKMLYRYIFKYDFRAWQGSFPIFVTWPREVICPLCLDDHGRAVLQSCGHMMHANCGYRYHSFPSANHMGEPGSPRTCPVCRKLSFIKSIAVVDS